MTKHKALIKIKKEPVPPIRKKNDLVVYHIYDGTSLDEIIKFAEENRIPFEEFFTEEDGHYDHYEERYQEEHYFKWNGLESEEKFQQRVDDYNKKKKEYDNWYKENKVKIEQELSLRTEEERQKVVKQTKAEVKKKVARIKRLEKELKKLKK